MDAVARSRSYAYIYKGFCAAKKVCSTCPLCNLKEATKAFQRMGELPTDRLLPYVPFSNISADICSPFNVRFKKSGKVWILVYLCNVSKALHLQIVYSNSGNSLTTTLSNVFARRNLLGNIILDAGNNFVKSQRLILGSKEHFSGFTEDDLASLQSRWM